MTTRRKRDTKSVPVSKRPVKRGCGDPLAGSEREKQRQRRRPDVDTNDEVKKQRTLTDYLKESTIKTEVKVNLFLASWTLQRILKRHVSDNRYLLESVIGMLEYWGTMGEIGVQADASLMGSTVNSNEPIVVNVHASSIGIKG